MIDIGSIAYGPELERRPVLRELERLSQALRDGSDARHPLELAYVIPGTMGRADFHGLKATRRRGGTKNTIVYIEVPPWVAESNEPLPGLVALATEAVRFAIRGVESKRAAPGEYDEGALLAELERAARRLGVSYPHTSVISSSTRPADAVDEHEDADAEAGVEVVLVTPNRAAVDRAFDLESALTDHLAEVSVGYVDGNEVGQGEFRIFAYGRDLPSLRQSIEKVVRRHWNGPSVRLRLRDSEDAEVEILDL